jgi:HlyD family secretion protein
VLAVFAAGCGKGAASKVKPLSNDPQVEVVKPQVRDITREVGQPSFVEAYEQTAIYAKLPGYIQEWKVDIGNRLKKDQVLATLFIPELRQELAQKTALVKQDRALIDQADKLVEVARANLKAADAQVKQARANVGQSEALVVRWESEVKRLTGLVKDRVVDQQILDESERQLQANVASREAARAGVETALANQVSAQASLDKSVVDVEVAKARLEVAEADEGRLQALVGYITLTSPYDGIVIARNANKGDFVLPATGDPSAAPRSPDQSAARATPIFTVARTDLVRVYVDVPEADAIHIVSEVDKAAGDPRAVTKGRVRVYAFNDEELPATVTRSAWALNFKSRTLRAEIDLKNPDAKLLPGMYAYGLVVIERHNVQALPMEAITEVGNQFGCYLLKDGQSAWTPVQTGVSDGKWIEVYKKRVQDQWHPFDGQEEVLTGDLSELADGRKVRVVKAAAGG